MSWIRSIVLALASLAVVSPVVAQTVIIIEVADGQYVGMAITPDGKQFALSPANITIKKLKVTPPVVEKKTTKVSYIYEKDNNQVPPQVAVALQRINADSGGSIVATEFEEDTIDGSDGLTPDQYVIALKAAREAGLPALVVQAGATVVRVIKDPRTEKEVLDAVK